MSGWKFKTRLTSYITEEINEIKTFEIAANPWANILKVETCINCLCIW